MMINGRYASLLLYARVMKGLAAIALLGGIVDGMVRGWAQFSSANRPATPIVGWGPIAKMLEGFISGLFVAILLFTVAVAIPVCVSLAESKRREADALEGAYPMVPKEKSIDATEVSSDVHA